MKPMFIDSSMRCQLGPTTVVIMARSDPNRVLRVGSLIADGEIFVLQIV
ncbi:hypothetical protein [Paraburkholderia sp. J41]|nr:hypothetical protein [Paraburkholderia sp. J41]